MRERFTNSALKEQVQAGTPLFDWLEASPKLKALVNIWEFASKQIPDHFTLKGKPLKANTIKSGGHETDSQHRKAVFDLSSQFQH